VSVKIIVTLWTNLRDIGNVEYPLLFYVVQIGLTAISFAIDHSAHSRVCTTLFALVYLIAAKSSAPTEMDGNESTQ
jgi:hypothetical protein